jgi:acyl carrier protein
MQRNAEIELFTPPSRFCRTEDPSMQPNEDILTQVTELIKSLAPEHQDITEGTDLVADLDFDSLKVMKLLEELEDRFDISVPLNLLPGIRTVEDLALQLQRIIDEE